MTEAIYNEINVPQNELSDYKQLLEKLGSKGLSAKPRIRLLKKHQSMLCCIMPCSKLGNKTVCIRSNGLIM